MIISFCGHSTFTKSDKYAEVVLRIIENAAKGKDVEFYLGGYGLFDEFACQIAFEYRKKHKNAKLFFVTPYVYENYSKLAFAEKYDGVIYPELESVPKRYAIIRRNYWIVEKSDLIIAYVNHSWGGAHKMYERAKKLGKRIINLQDISAE